MNQPLAFADILDAADQLDPEAQVELVAILNRRLAEQGRQRVVVAVEESRREFAAGQYRAMTAAELIREALS